MAWGAVVTHTILSLTSKITTQVPLTCYTFVLSQPSSVAKWYASTVFVFPSIEWGLLWIVYFATSSLRRSSTLMTSIVLQSLQQWAEAPVFSISMARWSQVSWPAEWNLVSVLYCQAVTVKSCFYSYRWMPSAKMPYQNHVIIATGWSHKRSLHNTADPAAWCVACCRTCHNITVDFKYLLCYVAARCKKAQCEMVTMASDMQKYHQGSNLG